MKKMKTKKVLFAVFFVFFTSHLVFSYEIDELWKACETNSEDVFSAKQNLNYYKEAKNTTRVLYPLSLNLTAGPDFYHNYEQYSEEIDLGSASALLSQTLPGGAKLSAGASYGVYSGYRTFSSANGYSDKGYSDSFSAQIQYTQSLNPYWIHGTLAEPSKRKLALTVNAGEYNLMQILKNSYTSVLSLYLQYRNNGRNILLAEKQVDMMKLNLESVKSMSSSNSALVADIWNAEQSLNNCETALNSYKLEKERILKSLRALCGASFEISESGLLPENPERFINDDPFLLNLNNQKLLLKNQLLLDKQNSAAVFSVSGQFTDKSKLRDDMFLDFYDDTNYLSWKASLSVKINNLYGGEGKLLKKKYETESLKYENQILKYQEKVALEKKYYDNLILSLEEKIGKLILDVSNEKEKFDGIKRLYENGQKRHIDVLSAEIDCLKQEYNLQNQKDALWQAKWVRLQFID